MAGGRPAARPGKPARARRRGLAAFGAAMLALSGLGTPPPAVLAQAAGYTYTPGEEAPEDFPPGPGREEAFYACVACHNFKLVAAQGMSRLRWDETVAFMIERHSMSEIGGEDRRLIVDYLAAAFPERAQPQRGWRNPFMQ